MEQIAFYRYFRLLAVFLHAFTVWTNFSSRNASDWFSGFFSYGFNTYSITFIVLNILLGFFIGIGHILGENRRSAVLGIRMGRLVSAGIPILLLSLGVYVCSTFPGVEIIRIVYIHIGVIHMALTEYAGAYNAMRFLLLSSYALQIVLGYIAGKSIYLQENRVC